MVTNHPWLQCIYYIIYANNLNPIDSQDWRTPPLPPCSSGCIFMHSHYLQVVLTSTQNIINSREGDGESQHMQTQQHREELISMHAWWRLWVSSCAGVVALGEGGYRTSAILCHYSISVQCACVSNKLSEPPVRQTGPATACH